MSSKLPRLYYSLKQAAKELDCDKDYLIHLGATGRVAIQQLGHVEGELRPIIEPKAGFFQTYSDQDTELLLSLLDEEGVLHVVGDVFIQLFPSTLRELELHGRASTLSFKDMTSIPPTDDFLLLSHAEVIESMAFGDESKAFLWGFRFRSYSEDVLDESGAWKEAPHCIKASQKRLFILASEIERLRRGETAEPIRDIPPNIAARLQHEPSPKGRNSYARTIAALSQALVGELSGKPHKDAGVILEALAGKGIQAPVSNACLANYLKEADEAGQKAKE